MADEAESPPAGRETEAQRIAHWDAEVCNALMSTPQGRFFVERFLDFCCEDQELYRDDGDALGMAKRDGLVKAARWLRVQIEAYCPDRWLQMIRERRGRVARAQAAIAAAEAARKPDVSISGTTPIEAMADEQARLAAEEAERERRKGKKKD